MKKYFGKYASSGDVQTALDSGALSKPYVAVVGNEMDYNSKEIDYASMPLTFEILTGGTIYWKCSTSFSISKRNITYVLNDGTPTTMQPDDFITVQAGDIVKLSGGNQGYAGSNGSYYHYFETDSTCKFKAYGNITSLTNGNSNYQYAFQKMFSNQAGRVPGVVDVRNLVFPETFAVGAFREIFNGCSYIDYIKCLATDISANGCTDGWVFNVSATGTFVKKAGVEWPSGNDGIPTGWTVIEE